MKKIIIFTTYTGLFNVSKSNRGKNKIDLIESNDIITLNPERNEFIIATEINNGNVFLIKDSISSSNLNSFMNEKKIIKESIGVLYHNNGGNDGNKFALNYNNLKGEHESSGAYYPLMLSIISDKKDKKFERLLEEVFGSVANSIKEKDKLEKHYKYIKDNNLTGVALTKYLNQINGK